MQNPTYIRARELDDWAASPNAKALLPELVSRLVKATVPRGDILKCDFPAEAETHRPDYDGTSVTNSRSEFVPVGICRWELGCDGKPETKAQGDYEKRLVNRNEKAARGEIDDLSEVTFIAVTPRDWHAPKPPKKAAKKVAKKAAKKSAAKVRNPTLGRDGWAAARSAEGQYARVLAYDSSILEQWIRDAPSVAFWLAAQLGRPISGASDVTSYWVMIQAALKVPLSPSCLLASRSEIAQKFHGWIAGQPSDLPVRGHSSQEVAAVFCAWVQTLPDDEKSTITSRAIVVEDRTTWKNLLDSPPSLILVCSPLLILTSEDIALAKTKGHYVLRHLGMRSPHSGEGVTLERMRESEFALALESDGMERNEALKIAKDSGGTYMILRRIFSKNPDTAEPAWAKDRHLALMVFAGAWEDERAGDKEAITRISGADYTTIQASARKWSLETNDPPIRLGLSDRGIETKCWRFNSLLDAWLFLHRLWGSEDLSRFSVEVKTILSEDNPALDLPPHERPLAAVKGKDRKYSSEIRGGICEILAIGAVRQDELGFEGEHDLAGLADDVVRSVFHGRATWKRWSSLSSQLPLLMEAAPEALLDAVESDLTSADPQIVELFRQEVPGLFGAAHHSGLLWALETASWSREFHGRVAKILTQLTELDPGGQWANRPLESATGIFFSHRRKSDISISERLDELRSLSGQFPDATWKILTKLLPRRHALIPSCETPSYRNWFTSLPTENSREEFLELIEGVTRQLVEQAGPSTDRWFAILEAAVAIYSLSSSLYRILFDAVAVKVGGELSDADREKWWAKLHQLVSEHTRFKDAFWAISEEDIGEWRSLLKGLGVEERQTTFVHLFSDDALIDEDESLTYQQQREKLSEKQRAAIRSIWEASRMEGIRELLSKVQNPFALGWSLGEEMGDQCFEEIIPAWLTEEDKQRYSAARNYAAQRTQSHGASWAINLSKVTWSNRQVAEFAYVIPQGTSTWDWLEAAAPTAVAHYWSLVNGHSSKFLTVKEAVRGADMLQKAGRPLAGLAFLIGCDGLKTHPDFESVSDALGKILAGPLEYSIGAMDSYRIQEALKILQLNVSTSNFEAVGALEFGFLGVLGHRSFEPVILHRPLSINPVFFVGMLSNLFRAGDDLPDDEEGDSGDELAESAPIPQLSGEEAAKRKHEARVAEKVWHLFQDWRAMPGTQDDGSISAEALIEWVTRSRELATAEKLLKVCDSQIGQLVSRSPEDLDGGRPHRAVRSMIEQIKSTDLDLGVEIGFFNQRRSFTRGLYEGGKQERALADQYDRYSSLSKQWPRVARILKKISKDYLKQAEREDLRAKERR